jgi:hypothetical protein
MPFQANHLRTLATLCLLLVVTGCASRSYQSQDVVSAPFMERMQELSDGPVTVRAAVPTARETRKLTGLDLYDQGVQPVWLEVTNNSEQGARISHWSIDRHYFSPIEVAYMNKGAYAGQGYADMEAWFHHNGLPRIVPPGETRKGFVYTNYRPGTKGFSLDVFANRAAHNFTFFIPMPGFTPDFENVDFAGIYDPELLRTLDIPGLRAALENELPCCAASPDGEADAAPFNLVLVAPPRAIRRSLLRSGWTETTQDDPATALARANFYRDRPPDGVFYKSRADGNERIELRLWLSPWNLEQGLVWVGQVVYGINDASLFAEFFTPHSPAADLDNAVRFILQDFWYNQSVVRAGYVGGVGRVPKEAPRESYSGHEYFTDGARLVMQLSEEPIAFDETIIIYPDTPMPELSDDD